MLDKDITSVQNFIFDQNEVPSPVESVRERYRSSQNQAQKKRPPKLDGLQNVQ
jgi:hypothetical protein